MKAWACAVAAALSAMALAGAARADDAPNTPPPDKSGYSLFNPTPAADERAFCTDRPTKSTGACTVDAGHLQVETDLVNYTYDRQDGMTTQTWIAPNPTLKLGVTNTLDLEVSWAPFEQVETRSRGARSTVSGIGDVYLKAKLNLLGDDSGDVAFSVEPYVKAPAARAGLGNGAVEGGVIAPIVANLPAGWSLTVDPELDILQDADGHGDHANLSGLLSFSHSVSKTLTASIEVWSDVDFEPQGTVRQYSFDLGLAWIPAGHPNVQLDGGVNLGLDRQTPAAQAYIGLSQRF